MCQISGADSQLGQGCQQRLELRFIRRTAPVISMYASPLNKYTSLKTNKSICDKAKVKTSLTQQFSIAEK